MTKGRIRSENPSDATLKKRQWRERKKESTNSINGKSNDNPSKMALYMRKYREKKRYEAQLRSDSGKKIVSMPGSSRAGLRNQVLISRTKESIDSTNSGSNNSPLTPMVTIFSPNQTISRIVMPGSDASSLTTSDISSDDDIEGEITMLLGRANITERIQILDQMKNQPSLASIRQQLIEIVRDRGQTQAEDQSIGCLEEEEERNPHELPPLQAMISSDPPMDYYWQEAEKFFNKYFHADELGHVCSVCDRIFFAGDMHNTTPKHHQVLEPVFKESCKKFRVCHTCVCSLNRKTIPQLSRSNGFHYPPMPANMPKLDAITQRLISPRLPFMSLRRLTKAGGLGIVGQVINVPIDVDSMVNQLPRQLDDDFAINVSLKKKLIRRTSYLQGIVKKRTVKIWLEYLMEQPLYKLYGIQVDWERLDANEHSRIEVNSTIEMRDHHRRSTQSFDSHEVRNDHGDMVEEIGNETLNDDASIALNLRQHTLLWDETYFLAIAPARTSRPLSLLFDIHAEELSFPQIYLGHARKIKEGVRKSIHMLATSEVRRSDRRGAVPEHLLYMAMKLLRSRVVDNIHASFRRMKNVENIDRRMLENPEFIRECCEKNAAFLKSIPNSAQYWHQRKLDLFAMIRQIGQPTLFMTLSSNEMHWPNLLRVLNRFNDRYHKNRDVSDPIKELNYSQRAGLVNDDPVLCCIYFQKMVDVLMRMLKSDQNYNPFGRYKVIDYFIRIEFQHRGSPHAHLLLWLDNDPKESVTSDMNSTKSLIADLISVNSNDLPEGMTKHQRHKHTFTCLKRGENFCRFKYPKWPMRETKVLMPLSKQDQRKKGLRKRATALKKLLDTREFESFESFLNASHIQEDHYLNVIRSTLTRPMLYPKRHPRDKLTNPFNPCIAKLINANMDIQYILDEYGCANYVIDYVNKSDRGISNLHRELINLSNENPEMSHDRLLRKIGAKTLNSVEMCAQEAAWYLLRQPMGKMSRGVVYVPTVWPQERNKVYKSKDKLKDIEFSSTDVWCKDIFQKYEERPTHLDDLCLADLATWFTIELKSDKRSKRSRHQQSTSETNSHMYRKREVQRILRYRQYPISDADNYKREMVTLFVPFRSETIEILDRNAFIIKYDQEFERISLKKSEYEIIANLEQVVEELMMANIRTGELFATNQEAMPTMILREEMMREVLNSDEEENFDDFLHNPMESKIVNGRSRRKQNLRNQSTGMVDIIHPKDAHALSMINRRVDIMSRDDYCRAMRTTNEKQRALILEVIHRLHSSDSQPLQIFFTGPAGSGKTFVLRLIMDTYNRFSELNDRTNNAYLACASTGKAAVNIQGTTIHSALHIIPTRKLTPIAPQNLCKFIELFKGVKCMIIDEISMISNELLYDINERMQQITSNTEQNFGGLPMIFCGDLRQLPPCCGGAIFKRCRNHLRGNMLWQMLDYYELTQVMRQSDQNFSELLTKIGNGMNLDEEEAKLIESRFRTEEWCDVNLDGVVRLYPTNRAVNEYNYRALSTGQEHLAKDIFYGFHDAKELDGARRCLHQKNLMELAGLAFSVMLQVDKPYMITTNLDITDGLVNGAIGVLRYIEVIQDSLDNSTGLQFDLGWYCSDKDIERPNCDSINKSHVSAREANTANALDEDHESSTTNEGAKDVGFNDWQEPKFQTVRVWIEFRDERTGAKARLKMRTFVRADSILSYNIQPNWTPIVERSASINLGGSVRCKRRQLPLASACAMTIHKSQGGTFDKIVYCYDKTQTNQSVYVALSRVRTLEGLYLINQVNDFNFYHKLESERAATRDIRDEYRRLKLHEFETLYSIISNFISPFNETRNNHSGSYQDRILQGDHSESPLPRYLIICTINAQSLVLHAKDIESDHLISRSDLLAVTETWMNEETCVQLAGYKMIGFEYNQWNQCEHSTLARPREQEQERPTVSQRRAGGVALYVKEGSIFNGNISERSHELSIMTNLSGVGDILVNTLKVNRSKIIAVATVYIHPNTTQEIMKRWLDAHLERINKIPSQTSGQVIITGDFNVNCEKNDWLARHMDRKWSLVLIKTPTHTTLGGSSIDLTFASRDLQAECRPYICYFSYHRPLFNKIKIT